MRVVAIIPARSGSKRIPNKNIRLYSGKPLIYWSISLALQSELIDEVVVSTDCETIKSVAEECGAKVPFLRPKNISGDLATDHEFVKHYIDVSGDKKPDLIIQLRPTYPNRTLLKLDDCIKFMKDNFNSYDSLRTVCENDKPAYKMYRILDNRLEPLFDQVDGVYEPYNQPAQILPKTFWHNGYIDIIKTTTVLNKGSITGDRIYPYIMDKDEVDDIDTEEEWIRSEQKHKHSISYQPV